MMLLGQIYYVRMQINRRDTGRRSYDKRHGSHSSIDYH
jgi:hypothetical protein